jgi:hypothetical protein
MVTWTSIAHNVVDVYVPASLREALRGDGLRLMSISCRRSTSWHPLDGKQEG